MDEFLKQEIVKRLKRQPNALEEHIFEAMWSEHCGYLHSKKQLKKLNYEGAIYAKENAGGIKIGNLGIFFKTESHNHPCAIEPYQGAATGIGGIIRDILALNARPVALLNSLKFAHPCSKTSRHIIEGVTAGISDYGNSCGIANVGGEVIFDKCYTDSPLVNVMALGIAPLDKVKLSAVECDCEIVLLGSATGLDGVGGAAFASKELNDNKNEDKIHVQIGDSFVKKKLIEATLQILNLDCVTACQDCGAAGLLSSTVEMAYKGKCSIELNLDKLHLAQSDISPAQILLSETQERMVFAIKKGTFENLNKIAQKYELEISNIGRTFAGGNYTVKYKGKILSDTPLEAICEPYAYELEPVCEPEYLKELRSLECSGQMQIDEAVKKMTGAIEFASKARFYERFDYAVGGRTYLAPNDSGAAAIKIYGDEFDTKEGYVGVCMDSKPRISALEPYTGAKATFLESFRNLVSSGFEPMGFTNCLNFANPHKEDVRYQFVRSIDGLAQISEQLSVPVVSGNVSFYNESAQNRVHPTVTIGMVGYCEDENDLIEAKFSPDEHVFLIGKKITPDSNVGGSLYQNVLFDFLGGGVDESDISLEIKLKSAILNLKKHSLLCAATDVSKGGLLGALLCVLLNSNIGFTGSFENIYKGFDTLNGAQKLKILFGEIESRYIFSTNCLNEVQKYLDENEIPYSYLGKTFGDKIVFEDCKFDLKELKSLYENAIQKALDDV